MSGNTALGLPTWADADPMAGIPSAIRALADAIDQKTIRKAADEIVNNSAALQNDNHLLMPVANGKVYKFKLVLFCLAVSSAADMKFAFTHPGGNLNWGVTQGMDPAVGAGAVGAGQFGGNTAVASGAGAIAVGVASTTTMIVLEGTYSPTANGNLQLQWAQNAATASDSTIKIGSFMEMQVI